MTPEHTEPIFDTGEPDNKGQLPLIPAGHQVTVENTSRAKKIAVHSRTSATKLFAAVMVAFTDKRPLGGLRRCDVGMTVRRLTVVRR